MLINNNTSRNHVIKEYGNYHGLKLYPRVSNFFLKSDHRVEKNLYAKPSMIENEPGCF